MSHVTWNSHFTRHTCEWTWGVGGDVTAQPTCGTCIGAHCNTLKRTTTHCNTLRHTATHCNTLQHTATWSNILPHTTTHCNTRIIVWHPKIEKTQQIAWQLEIGTHLMTYEYEYDKYTYMYIREYIRISYLHVYMNILTHIHIYRYIYICKSMLIFCVLSFSAAAWPNRAPGVWKSCLAWSFPQVW